MGRTSWLALAWLLTACTVEDVIVDTGGSQDTETVAADTGRAPPADRPEVDDDATDEVVEDEALLLDPEQVERGGASVVFLSGPGLDDVSAVQLYGEPDARLETWTQDGPERLVLVVDVDAGSPVGELLVVLEHDDGRISRPDAPLEVL